MKKKIKILVIEDDNFIRNNISEILRHHGYDVIDVDTGEKGLEILSNYCPAIVLCDIMLPGINGYQVLDKFNKSVKLECRDPCNVQRKMTSFIFITAKASRSDFRIGMNLGADDYIAKPFSSDELLNAIKIRIQKTEEIEQLLLNRYDSSTLTKNEPEFAKDLFILTKQEINILHLISQGLSTPQISQKLFLSKRTVENHRANITRKLNLRGSYSLTNFALRLNYSSKIEDNPLFLTEVKNKNARTN